jgi:hypothetical protein
MQSKLNEAVAALQAKPNRFDPRYLVLLDQLDFPPHD